MVKIKWTRPILMVMTRGKAEEMVLDGCKNNLESSGADNGNLACWDDETCIALCSEHSES